jgi:adenine-specific DNA-methyltransferase
MTKHEIRKYARNLRQNETTTEAILWSRLRSRQLSGYKIRRQHPVEHAILDFYCSEVHLAIKLDGGHHAEKENIEKDNLRTNFLNERGIRIIRFWNHEVLENLDVVLTEIDAVIKEIVTNK